MTRKYWGPTTQPTTPNQPLVNQLEVIEPSLGLDLIDSQSSWDLLGSGLRGFAWDHGLKKTKEVNIHI